MEEKKEVDKSAEEDSNSLENPEKDSSDDSSSEASKKTDSAIKTVKKGGISVKFRRLVSKLNVYLLVFILLVVIGLIVTFVSYQTSQEPAVTVTGTQELTQEAIDELVGSDSIVGDPKQLLTIESDSVFTGKVLIRDGLDVAGTITVGGSLSLPGITVSGTSTLGEVVLNTLNVSGDVSIQGQVSIQQGLTVSGPVTFSGTLSAAAFAVEELSVNQDLTINRHIDAGGPTPGLSNGGALGSGGTATISGTDTAGTVTFNIGSGASSGVLATISFANPFGGTPHVVITPIASEGAATVSGTQKFYLSNRTTTSFSIATSGSLPAGSISFDYIVLD
jgi:cytoskeletal protein CcmA (bactofilin family)